MTPELVKPSEAAEALGVSRMRIYGLMDAGEIPTVYLGKSRRIPAESLREWVRSHTQMPIPKRP